MSINQMIETITSCYKAGNRTQLVGALENICTSDAMSHEQALSLTRIAANIGELTVAKKMLEQYAIKVPSTVDSLLTQGSLLAEFGQIDQALKTVASSGFAFHPAIEHLKGSLLSQKGDLPQALICFRNTLNKWQNVGQTWNALAAIKSFSQEDADLRNMLSAQKLVEDADDVSRGNFYYAIGKAQHDIGLFDKAAQAYMAGAKAMGNGQRYDQNMQGRMVKAIENSFSEQALSKLACNSKCVSHQPIFVLGWPRSGTTLVERVISSHPQVLAGGEVDFVRKVSMEMRGMSAMHGQRYQQTFHQSEQAWEYMASLYLHLVEERFGEKTTIVDKTLGNSRYLGLISKIFPHSPIIWLRRNPVDAAFSCFRTCFSGSMPWSWSLENIAHHFMLEDLLFGHWSKVLKDKILVVPYEEFVTEPEIWAEKIFKYCGLAMENTFDSFHLDSRPCFTSSSVQVRRPINHDTIGLSKKYAQLMQPFRARYQISDELGIECV